MDTLGFTGTQLGMSVKQAVFVRSFLRYHKPKRVRHGDCIGADERFHFIVREEIVTQIHIHPPSNPSKRAYCEGDIMHKPKTYLRRNKDIVESDWLLATPSGPEILRNSGTWATIRYARKKGIPITIVYPDGRVENEN